MKNKTLIQKLLIAFNVLMVIRYKNHRKGRSTVIDFARSPSLRKELNLQHLSPWKAVKAVDRIIDESISHYGVSDFKNIPLYALPVSRLKDALLLIKHGVAKQDDFKSDKPISKVVESTGTNFMDTINDRIWNKAFSNVELIEKARALANNQDEFSNLKVEFCSYYEWILRNQEYTALIETKIKAFGFSEYQGQNVYKINNADLLKEALDALGQMWILKVSENVVSFNGQPIQQLSLFTLRKIRKQVENKDATGIIYDEGRMQERKKKREDYERQCEKRNAAARARRARIKAEKEAEAKKAAKKAAVPAKACKNPPVVPMKVAAKSVKKSKAK